MTDLREGLQQALGAAYTVERELGGGGMSRVFVALENALGRRVVVKVLPPALGAEVSGERFRREVQTAARLQHPHIVPVLTSGSSGEIVYYTMPLVDGESLRERLARDGELPVAAAVPLLREIATALGYAHRHGVVHRDVKPDNVMVSDGYALVTDFGIAKAVASATRGDGESSDENTHNSTITALGVALGTPAYMAPEQGAADPLTDHRADIYAFGCLAYEMLTGHPPFVGRSPQALFAAHSVETPEGIQRRRSSVPDALAAIVMRCLEKRPADRPQSADELTRALDGVLTASAGTTAAGSGIPLGTSSGARLPSDGAVGPTSPRARTPRRRAGMVAIGAVLGLAMAAGAVTLRRNAFPDSADAGIVVVLPFRVTSADQSLQFLREGMLDLLAAKLADRPRAVDPRAVLAAWRKSGGDERADPDPDDVIALASTFGAGRLLDGEVVGTGSRVVLSGRLLEMPSGRERARATSIGSAGDLAVLVDSLAAKLLALDAGEGASRAALLGGIPLPALQAYLDGQSATRAGTYQAAVDAYARAIEIDSTFALAAIRLSFASLWTNDPRGDPARQLATRHRHRLGARDQWLVPDAETLDRETSTAARIARFERAVSEVPDMPELWFQLGDEYFHRGLLLGIPDADQRSIRAFERALAIDSGFREAVEHLPALYFDIGDSVALSRAATRLAADTLSDFAPLNMFAMAVVRGDSIGRQAAVTRLLAGPVGVALTAGAFAPEYLEWTPEGGEVLRAATERASSPADQRMAARIAYFVRMNRGQPMSALGALRENTDLVLPRVALGAVLWDADSAGTAPYLATMARLAASPPPDSGELRTMWAEAVLAVGQEALLRGDTLRTRVAVRRLLAVPSMDASPLDRDLRQWMVMLLDAQLAATANRPDARARLVSLDSVLRLGPVTPLYRGVGNLIVGRLWEQQGDLVRARAALRRITRGPLPTPFISTYLRERARLSAALGDNEAAISDYRRYLSARGNVEPRLAASVAATRAELARLERLAVGR